MHVDLFLPQDVIENNKLVLFDPVILNNTNVAVVGLSRSKKCSMPYSSLRRYLLSEADKLIVSKPTRVLSALFIEIYTNRPEVAVSDLFMWSLLLRLQYKYIQKGTTQCFNILGCETMVHFVSVTSSEEKASDESFIPDKWLSKYPFQIPAEYIGENSIIEIPFVSFSEVKPGSPIYKISSATKIKVLSFTEVPSSISSNQPNIQPPDIITIALEGPWNSVVKFIRRFSLSTKFSTYDEPTGLLLYGLQGCGKSQILSQLSGGFSHGAEDVVNDIKNEDWFKRLFILSLQMDDLSSKMVHNSNSLKRYLGIKASTLPETCSGVVVCLPNLDNWFTVNHSSDSESNDDSYGSDAAMRSSYFLTTLRAFLAQLCAKKPVCVLATCIDSVDILKHRHVRNLFYKKLLIPLPSGNQRSLLLTRELQKRFREMNLGPKNSFLPKEELDKLHKVAASLHGYTVMDISRLFRASFAAAIDDANTFRNRSKTEDSKTGLVPPTVLQILEKLESEKSHYRPVNLMAEISTFPPIRWTDIGGYADIKKLFITSIQKRLIEAADPTSETALMNKQLGLNVPRGLLLHGPPGCSKTLFVRALATECNLPLVAVQASRIFGRYVGDSERNMQRILVHARACAPSILFIDEIDLLLPSRSSSESGVSEHVLGEVLTAMDGVEGQCGQLLLIAATNRLENLDPALRRRFDFTIPIPAPDAESRLAILQLELSKRATAVDALDACWLVCFAREFLEGYTGAEVVGVVQAAAELTREAQRPAIGREQLLAACESLPPSTLEQYHTQLLGRVAPHDDQQPFQLKQSQSAQNFFNMTVTVSVIAFLVVAFVCSIAMS